MRTRPGIPTTYRGTNFRSRLEARWAAFFDLIGWRWTYEPIDAKGYIPDFLIHGEYPIYVEVGPCSTFDDFVTKARKGIRAELDKPLLVVGIDPIHAYRFDTYREDGCLLFRWHATDLVICPHCQGVALGRTEGMTPCGHDGYVVVGDGGFFATAVEAPELKRDWAVAGNQTQWRPA
jgi:hypothetical protein